jgi:ectoine hydroxylase-related dioxygenase (phytanoyl-CoA dioxygenase family)
MGLSGDQGFLVIPAVLTEAEAGTLRIAVETMSRSRAGSRNVLGHPAVRNVAEDRRLVGIAAEFLGGNVFPFKATLFDKSPTSNWLVTWHQDLALPIHARTEAPGWGPWTEKGGCLHALAPADVLTRVVALRVHLDPSTSENGPLRVLPDTHRSGRLSAARIAELAGQISAVECVAPAGGLVVMRPLLLHASSKSTVDLSRRVLHFEYTTARTLAPGIELAVA